MRPCARQCIASKNIPLSSLGPPISFSACAGLSVSFPASRVSSSSTGLKQHRLTFLVPSLASDAAFCSLRTINSRSHLLMSAEPILVPDRVRRSAVRTYENTHGEGRGNFLFARNHARALTRTAHPRCRVHHMVSKVLMSRRESVSRHRILRPAQRRIFFDSKMQDVAVAELFPGPCGPYDPKWFRTRKNFCSNWQGSSRALAAVSLRVARLALRYVQLFLDAQNAATRQ